MISSFYYFPFSLIFFSVFFSWQEDFQIKLWARLAIMISSEANMKTLLMIVRTFDLFLIVRGLMQFQKAHWLFSEHIYLLYLFMIFIIFTLAMILSLREKCTNTEFFSGPILFKQCVLTLFTARVCLCSY